jgi:hypothetical protein
VVGEPGAPPHVLVHLHDDGAGMPVVGVAVQLDDAVRGPADVEGERLEDLVGAQPHVTAPARFDGRLERTGIAGTHGRVDPVGGDHQVVLAAQPGHVRRLRPEPQLDPEVAAALLEDLQQPAPADRGEPVPAAGHDLPAVVHVDVVPAGELALEPGADHRVGVLDAAEGLVGEDHAEAEGVVGGVALPDRDPVLRAELLGQRGEVEPAGAATDDSDVHPTIVLS